MKEFPRIFGMRLMPSLPLVSYIISPQISLFCTNQFKVIVTSEVYCIVNTNKSRVKRTARRQDEDMETYVAGKRMWRRVIHGTCFSGLNVSIQLSS